MNDPDRFARIQLVTRRFNELQGLWNLALCATCLATFAAQPYVRLLRYSGPAGWVLGLVLSVMPMIAVLALRQVSTGYYRRRFGRVAAPAHVWWTQAATVGLLAAAVFLDIVRQGRGGPSALLVAGAVLSLHIVVRDWPFRTYHLLAAVTCAAGAWVSSPSGTFPAPPELAQVNVSILLAANLLPAYLDHRLLASTLPANPDAARMEGAAALSETDDASPV